VPIPANKLVDVVEGSFVDLWTSTRARIPGTLLHREADMVIYSTGIPNSRFNGVLDARFTEENVAKRTNFALSHFQNRQLPMTWHVGSLSTPEDLGARLESNGMTLDDVVSGMAVDLTEVQDLQRPSELKVHSISDQESLRDCIAVVAEAYGFTEDVRETLFDVYTRLGIDSQHRWVLGKMRGLPVGTSLLILHEGYAVIWIVGTIPEARGQGIGTAITHSQLMSARDVGCRYAVLQSTEMGFPVYKKLGFEKCCDIRAYTWSPHKP